MISRRAADRLRAGHLWVYRSDIEHMVEMEAGLIAVADHRGFPLGTALWSPTSQIALRLVTSDPHLTHEAGWRCSTSACATPSSSPGHAGGGHRRLPPGLQ
jgi:23S rRNA (cytosine1962-C5)-methyltransferase